MTVTTLERLSAPLVEQCAARFTNDGALDLTVDFEDGRRRSVHLDERIRLGAALIELRCTLADADAVDPRMALAVNDKLALGALAIADNSLVFIHRTPSEGLDSGGLLATVRRVASIADTLDASLLVSDAR